MRRSVPWIVAALLVSSLPAATQPAAAQPAPPPGDSTPECGERVVAWVTAAGRATGVPIRAVRCLPGNTRVTLAAPGAPPLDVEVADPPGPAFRHAGRLRVSPIVEVADYSMLPEPQRRAYEALVDWLTVHGDDVGGSDATDVEAEPMGPWLPLTAAALLLALAIRLARVLRHDLLAAAVLLLTAAALRYGFGLFGPLHVNGQGPLWVAGALEPWLLVSYGPGYPELFSWLAARAPVADTPIFTANLWFAAAASPLGYALARSVGAARGMSLLVGAVLALDPISTVYFVSESYLPSIIALLLASQLALLVGAGCQLRREKLNTALALLSAGLFVAAAARVHPISYLPAALSALVVLAAPGAGMKVMLRTGALAVLCIGAIVLATSHETIRAALDLALLHGTASPHHATAAELTLVVAMVFVGLALRKRWLGAQAGWLAAVALAAAFATRDIYSQHTHWQLSYDRLFMPMIVLGVAGCLPPRLARPVPGVLMVIATVAALTYPGYALLVAPPTEVAEYRFLREALADAPPGCALASVERVGQRVTLLPHYAMPPAADGSRRRISLEATTDLVAAATPGRCLRYVHSSLCNSTDGRPHCDAVEASLGLEEVARFEAAAQASYVGLGYDRDPVEIIVYRPTAAPR